MLKQSSAGRLKIGVALFLFFVISLFNAVPVRAANVTVQVLDQSGAAVSGTTVYAIQFGNTGPNAANSRIGTTDANGNVTLSLTDGVQYDLFASKHGLGPAVRTQMFNPSHPHITVASGLATQTITLNTTFSDRGKVIINVSSATANKMVFGNINKLSDGSDVGFGAAATDATGAATMTIDNVPAAAASIYNAGAFDPSAVGGQGQGNGATVSSALTAGGSVSVNVNIANGLPPDQSATSGSQSRDQQVRQDQSVGGGILEGAVVDVNYATMTVPFGNVELRQRDSVGNTFGAGFSPVDQNGRFRFVGLTVGNTYYVRAFGGCRFDGTCYDGYDSTGAVSGVPVLPNDFVFTSSATTFIHNIVLKSAAAGTANLPVYVRDSLGRLIPGAWVNLWPDGNPWHVNPSSPICDGQFFHGGGVDVSNPGLANANLQATTGYALVPNLRAGNYGLSIGSPFTREQVTFNGGADGIFTYGQGHRGCFSGSYDDLRLAISTNNTINVYNTSGTVVTANASSITVVIPTLSNSAATLTGTLKFPAVVDLRSQPITIILRGQCDQSGCRPGNFASVGTNNETPAATYTYSINVATGTYFPEVVSTYWGVVRNDHGDFQIDLNSGGTLTRDFTFAVAGRATGKMLKPNGSVFIPGRQSDGNFLGGGVDAQGLNIPCFGHVNLNEDGTYSIGGLLPGRYTLRPQIFSNGSANYTAKEPAETVTIQANSDSYKDVSVVEGVVVTVDQATAGYPTLITISDPFGGVRGETYKVRRTPQGFIFNGETLGQYLTREGDFGDSTQIVLVAPGSNGPCGPGFSGWCPQRVPANQSNDFYLVRAGDFDAGIQPYMTILKSKKNVILDKTHASLPSVFVFGSTATPVHVSFDTAPVTVGVVVTGNVTATNFLRSKDFESFGGNFQNFLKFIPVVALYNSQGELQAAGMVTPAPSAVAGPLGDQIEAAVRNNDFNTFRNLMSGLTFSYTIRGVRPGQSLTLTGTTPNYPPYEKVITVGADGSTTTVNINWDTEVGAGATLTGVVTSTASVAIANAAVTVGVRGQKDKVLATDSNGAFKTEGLPLGVYKINVSADGYAPAAKSQTINSVSTFTVNFALKLGPGSITGTIRELTLTSRGPVVRPVADAKVFCFDDTFNLNNITEQLALYKVQSSSVGVYTVLGLIPNDVIKCNAVAPGRYISSISTAATSGVVSGVDVLLQQKPLDIHVYARKTDTSFEFRILNPNNFDSGRVYYADATGGFQASKATEISSSFTSQPDGSLVGSLALTNLSANGTYILHIDAQPKTGEATVSKEITFGLNQQIGAQVSIDKLLIGDTSRTNGVGENEVRADAAGGPSAGLIFNAGSLITTSSADIPTTSLTQTSSSTLTGVKVSTALQFVGSVCNVSFSSVSFTGRPNVFCFPYTPSAAGANLANLAVYNFNTSTNRWEKVSGQVTISPADQTACMEVNPNTLAFQQSLGGARASMAASSDGKQFLVNPLAAVTGTSDFVVALDVSTGTVAATDYHQYNFPNPFNLQDKTVTLRTGTSGVSSTIRGTYLVVAPTGADTTDIGIRIYNVAGDMVREIKGQALGSRYNYFHWDGKNNAGDDVASGVYFATVDAPGAPKKEPIKMVVVK